MKIRCILLILLGIIALGCGGSEFDPPTLYFTDDVDIRDIRVFAAIDPPLTGFADIKIVFVGPYCGKCLHYQDTEYQLEETRLFVCLVVGITNVTCFCEPNILLRNVSGEVSLRLPLGEYSVFQWGKRTANPSLSFESMQIRLLSLKIRKTKKKSHRIASKPLQNNAPVVIFS